MALLSLIETKVVCISISLRKEQAHYTLFVCWGPRFTPLSRKNLSIVKSLYQCFLIMFSHCCSDWIIIATVFFRNWVFTFTELSHVFFDGGIYLLSIIPICHAIGAISLRAAYTFFIANCTIWHCANTECVSVRHTMLIHVPGHSRVVDVKFLQSSRFICDR